MLKYRFIFVKVEPAIAGDVVGTLDLGDNPCRRMASA
jgi:hypothetical protein